MHLFTGILFLLVAVTMYHSSAFLMEITSTLAETVTLAHGGEADRPATIHGKLIKRMEDSFPGPSPTPRQSQSPTMIDESFQRELNEFKLDVDRCRRRVKDHLRHHSEHLRHQEQIEDVFKPSTLLSAYKDLWEMSFPENFLEIPNVLLTEPSNAQELQLAQDTLREFKVKIHNYDDWIKEKLRDYNEILPIYQRELDRIRPRWPDFYPYLFYHLRQENRALLANGYEKMVRKLDLETDTEEKYRNELRSILTLMPVLDTFFKSDLAENPDRKVINRISLVIAKINRMMDRQDELFPNETIWQRWRRNFWTALGY